MPQSLELRLYVAGEAPNSKRALNNLKSLCAALHVDYSLEVIDVLEQPARALTDGVRLTPTLVKAAPPPAGRLIGDLSDAAQVLAVLGVDRDAVER